MLYLISFAEIFFANSASGYVLAILLHTLFLGGVVWLKTRQHLRPTHYYITLATITAVAVGIFSNLNFVLGLLNKNTTLTGRIPMWTILLGNIFIQHPWVGQGFDTIWADLNFRLRMGALVGWGYSPGQSDNGFIDILLNLGVVGFILFLLNYIKVWINSVHFLLQELSLESLFPIIFMVYSLFANLTWSMFMASEIFTWMVIIVFMVITIPKNRDTQPILYN
jgi:O-antigen ligase